MNKKGFRVIHTLTVEFRMYCHRIYEKNGTIFIFKIGIKKLQNKRQDVSEKKIASKIIFSFWGLI